MRQNILFGVPIERASKQDILEICKKWLTEDFANNYCRQIATINPEFLMEARKNLDFLEVLQKADLRIADGFGLVCASVFLYGWKKIFFRMTGVELTDILAELCAETGKKIYLIGADPGIAEKAARVLQKKFPSLVVVGAEEGISKDITQRNVCVIPAKVEIQSHISEINSGSRIKSGMTDKDLCARISAAGADVLLVAFGAPKQDIWIAEHKEQLSGVKIAVGVGGTFDYLSGIVPYAPCIMRAVGLEWLFRLITQPWRLGRIVTAVIRFPIAVVFQKCKRK